ncbi:MAG: LPS export ABC transporter periplasmic protein LptC [Rhodocyclaceae bacterium]|nr:MAG: LPS export ABC transporter periplasmic protein LptC [Rhodocyclaceae bacterium]
MKAWSTAVFPIAVLTTLAGLSFWLLHATSLDEPKRDGKDRHDPDYMINGMRLNKLDKTGRLQYTLTAKQVVHFPDDDSTDVTLPHLVYLSPSKPTLTMSSMTAHITSEGETVFMKDDVRIKRDATATRPALFGYMPDLTIQTEEETAETASAVRFTQGNSWLTGVGMNIDNKTQTYVLQSRARGEFESRKAQARK